MLLYEFNEIYRCHATYCMIKMMKTTNNEMFKEFVHPEFNKYCNSLFLMYIILETFWIATRFKINIVARKNV